MGTKYEQGYTAENDLHNRLLDEEFVVMRAYKSKGPFDLLAACKGLRPLLIEVKYYKAMTGDYEHKEDRKIIKRIKKTVNIQKLQQIAEMVDAYPLLAFKIKRKGFLFHRLDIDKYYLIPYRQFQRVRYPLLIAPNFKR